MGREKKKVIPLKTIEEQIEQGIDPRLSMTPEEIREYARQEDEALSRRIGKFVQEVPQPDTSELEVEEEDEVYSIDLEKKTIEEKTDLLAVGPGLLNQLVEENPYTKVITNIFISKAIAKLVKDIRKRQNDLEEFAEKTPLKAEAEALRKLSYGVYDTQIQELKRCWISGTNKVQHEKIPDWAVVHIQEYITDTLTSLILFADE